MDERNEMILLIFWIRGGVVHGRSLSVLKYSDYYHSITPILISDQDVLSFLFSLVWGLLSMQGLSGYIMHSTCYIVIPIHEYNGCFALQFTHVFYLTSASLLILNTNLFSTTSKLYLTGMTTIPKTLPVATPHNLIASPESIFSSLTS